MFALNVILRQRRPVKMKKIEAIIKPFRINEVRTILVDAGFTILHIYEVQESTPSPHSERVSGTEYPVNMHTRSILTLITEDNQTDRAINIISKLARTDNPEDGRIIVTSIDNIISLSNP